ncbi:MAG: hypothetical protein ACLVL7_03415 [Anaerotruncus massiliensis (ex Togo et al. 2019)]
MPFHEPDNNPAPTGCTSASSASATAANPPYQRDHQQDTALTSEVAGTTTDPVYKAMEIHGIGPCMLI